MGKGLPTEQQQFKKKIKKIPVWRLLEADQSLQIS
jgi:hypothetical protein